MINNGYADEMKKLAAPRTAAIKRLLGIKAKKVAQEKAIFDKAFAVKDAAIGGPRVSKYKSLDGPAFLRRKI